MKKVLSLLLVLALLPGIASTASVIIGNTSAPDAYIYGLYPTTNYGTKDQLEVVWGEPVLNPTLEKHSLLRYDWSGWTNISAIHNATLHVYLYSWAKTQTGFPYTPPTYLDIDILNSTDELGWSETNVTWANAPSVSVLQSTYRSTSSDVGKWVQVNVTPAFQYELGSGNNITSLRLNSTTSDGYNMLVNATFYSREAPYLTPYIELNVSWVPAGDSEAPTFNESGINDSSVNVGDSVKHSVMWDDDTALDDYIFGWSGSSSGCDNGIVNDTVADLTATPQNLSVNKLVPSACEGRNVTWQTWANDTANNGNTTYPMSGLEFWYSVVNVSPSVSGSWVNDSSVYTDNEFCVNLTASDSGSGVNASWVTVTYPNSSIMNMSLSNSSAGYCNVGGDVWGRAVQAGTSLGDVTVNFSWANDSAGNLGTETPAPSLNVTVTSAPLAPGVSTDKGNYSQCGKVFYRIRLYSANDTLYSPTTQTVLNVSSPADNVVHQFTFDVSNGEYTDRFRLHENASSGVWTLRALAGSLGRMNFSVGQGHDDNAWRITMNLSSVRFNSTLGGEVNASFTVFDADGEGVPGLSVGSDLFIYNDTTRFTPYTTVDQGFGHYYFLYNSTNATAGAAHNLTVQANASTKFFNASAGYYVVS